MKEFLQYMVERDGLGNLGNQDLADDVEKPDVATPDLEQMPGDNHELQIIRKAMRIAVNAGEQYRQKVHSFLRRLARDLPQIHNLVSQLDDGDEDEKSGDNLPHDPNRPTNKPVVSTPSADSAPDPSGGAGNQ